jgi:transcriptional regulator with XRE-family HTH domain
VNGEKVFNGEVLREFRRKHDLTQVKLARMLEIERTYLARMETGDKVPSVRLQRRIREFLVQYESEKRTAERCGFTIINLANITSNLNAQVQANSNLVSHVDSAIVQADTFMQGLKHHWLLRSAFKEKKPPKEPKQYTPVPRSKK